MELTGTNKPRACPERRIKRVRMQALAKRTEVILFGFEGVETQPFSEEEGGRKTSIKVFFAYFLVHKKVSWC